MNFNTRYQRLRAILLSPRSVWSQIASEPATTGSLYRHWILWLAAIPPLATFFGYAVFGLHLPFIGTFRPGFGILIAQLLLSYTVALLMVWILAWITAALAPSFGAQKNPLQALKTIAYAMTPIWVVGILHLLPILGLLTALLSLAALAYSVWHLHEGLIATMQTPRERAIGYTTVVVIIGIVLGWVLGLIVMFSSGMQAMLTPSMTQIPSRSNDRSGQISQAAKSMATFGKALQQAANGVASSSPEQPLPTSTVAVSLEQLKALLPKQINGLDAVDTSAESSQLSKLQISSATTHFRAASGLPTIQLSITDYAGASGMLALIGLVQTEKQTAHGYQKTFRVNGRPAKEQWNRPTQRGSFGLVVGGRFLVEAKGHAKNMTTLRDAVLGVNLKKLQAMRTEGTSGHGPSQ